MKTIGNRSIARGRTRSGLLGALCLLIVGGPTAVPQETQPLTGAAAQGRPIGESLRPDFFVDEEGRMLVVDHLRGFIVGRFQPPLGLAQGQPTSQGGVALDTPMRMGPELPATPLTTLRAHDGFPLVLESAIAGSPCVADLDGDGRREIVVATVAGAVYLIGSDGEIWPGWPVSLAGPCYAPPAAGDLDGDGRAEIVVGSTTGTLHVWRLDGTAQSGWPRSLAEMETPPTPSAAIFGAAALADLDGDGRAEISVAAANGMVWTLTGRGEVRNGWPQAISTNPGARIFPGTLASPAVADLDGDGSPEIVVATNSGKVHAWRATGEYLAGWPVAVPHGARAGFGDPAIGDVDGDGRLDVVVTSEQGGNGIATVAVFTAEGRPLPGWPFALPGTCNAGAALADLDGDGAAEIVVATIGGDASLFVLSGADAAPLPGWPVHFSHQTINASPLIADLDSDGGLDILVPTLSTDLETHSWLWAGGRQGRELRAFPIFLPHDEIVRAAPVVADLDGDGGLELISATEVISSVHVWNLEALDEPGARPWPALSCGPSRQGLMGTADGDSRRARRPAEPPGAAPSAGASLGTGTEEMAAGRADLSTTNVLSTVAFDLRQEVDVCLGIFDIQGTPVRKLLDHLLPPGHYEILWDGRDDSGVSRESGIYFYQLSLGHRATTRQLLLLK